MNSLTLPAYLRMVRHNWIEGKPVVYLDKAWADAHVGKNKAYR